MKCRTRSRIITPQLNSMETYGELQGKINEGRTDLKSVSLTAQELSFITEILKMEMEDADLSNKQKYIIHDLIEKLQD